MPAHAEQSKKLSYQFIVWKLYFKLRWDDLEVNSSFTSSGLPRLQILESLISFRRAPFIRSLVNVPFPQPRSETAPHSWTQLLSSSPGRPTKARQTAKEKELQNGCLRVRLGMPQVFQGSCFTKLINDGMRWPSRPHLLRYKYHFTSKRKIQLSIPLYRNPLQTGSVSFPIHFPWPASISKAPCGERGRRRTFMKENQRGSISAHGAYRQDPHKHRMPRKHQFPLTPLQVPPTHQHPQPTLFTLSSHLRETKTLYSTNKKLLLMENTAFRYARCLISHCNKQCLSTHTHHLHLQPHHKPSRPTHDSQHRS